MFAHKIAYSYYLLFSYLISRVYFKVPREDQIMTIRKILVFDIAHIGDVIRTTPIFHNLRASFKNVHISVVIGKWAFDVVELDPNIDEIFIYESRHYCRNGKKGNIKNIISLLKKARKEKYDLIIECSGDFFTLIMQLFSKTKFRLDWQPAYVYNYKYNRGRIKPIKEAKLDMLRRVGLPIITRNQYLVISEQDKINASNLVKKDKNSFIVVASGMEDQSRTWPKEKYCELISKLLKEFPDHLIYFLGSAREKAVGEEYEKYFHGGLVNLAGKTSLRTVANIIERSLLFIGNDSGLLHIARALNTNVVAIFGPTDPYSVIGPESSRKLRVVHKPEHQNNKHWARFISAKDVFKECTDLIRMYSDTYESNV